MQREDYDNTIFTPGTRRVRNILTLEEKIAVINAYDQRLMYKKVARMFNCSCDQIKNIITNRTAVMNFYYASKKQSEMIDLYNEEQMELKHRKIKFLGECVYECIQRLQFHANLPITEDLIRHKAFEFLEVLCIPAFTPSKKWLNLFKATYNITLSSKQIAIYTKPQSSLDIKDIMAYCTTHKDDHENPEYEAKRLRKLNFLRDALKEYMIRAKFHHKSMKLDTTSVGQVAREFNEILKVRDFRPTTEWVAKFIERHESEVNVANVKRPLLSLDLKDILSHCSRVQNKTKENAVTLAPKESALQMRVTTKYPVKCFPESSLKFQQNSIVHLDEQDGGERAGSLGDGEKNIKTDRNNIHVERPQPNRILSDVKPHMEVFRVGRPNLEQPTQIKIRKIESINNDPELQRKFPNNIEIRKVPVVTAHEIPKDPPKPTAKTIVYIQKVPASIAKENIARLNSLSSNHIKSEETLEDNNYIIPTNTIIKSSSPPQLRIHHVHEQVPLSYLSPRHLSPPQLQRTEDNDAELPRHVTCFKDALLLLKPLEEYAMLKENYRAIGLITQLEKVLKNEPMVENTGDEEFIG